MFMGRSDTSLYYLYMAEDDGEVDDDLPALAHAVSLLPSSRITTCIHLLVFTYSVLLYSVYACLFFYHSLFSYILFSTPFSQPVSELAPFI